MDELEVINKKVSEITININDEAPLDSLNESLRELCDQQNKILNFMQRDTKGSPNYQPSELQRTLARVSTLISTIAEKKAGTDGNDNSPLTKKRMTGPPEIPPDEILFDPVKDYLGGGAYGKVYRGFCRGKHVAVKVPVRQFLSEAELQSFRNEVNIMSQIFHPNVVLYLGASTQPNRIMIVTELMKTDVEKLIHHNPDASKITLFQRMKLAKDAALGMNWLHGICKIIHRDLKPANLLVDSSLVVKVTDFGFAESLKSNRYLLDKKGPKGTALYMAPEVMRQEGFNEKADVYSFGLILWELLTGEEPFPQYEELDPFFQAICYDDERPPIPANSSPRLTQLMQKCWDPDPTKRPAFDSVVKSLDDILVECCISDEGALAFWKKYFLAPKNTLQEEVAARDFILALSIELRTQFTQQQTALFQSLVSQPKPTSQGVNHVITMERMQLLTSWFGKFYEKKQVVEEMVEIEKQEWFHGMIAVDVAERRLRGRLNGTFLVRLSMGNPYLNPYTISRFRDGRITHKRVTRVEESKLLSVPVDNKVMEFETLVGMIKKLKEIGNLGADCPHNEIAQNPYISTD